MDNSTIYGFFGGIVGGICVNFVTFHYKKRFEKKEKVKDDQKESQKKTINKLKEIEFSLESYLDSDRSRYTQMQNECFIFSDQLTNILSQVTNDISEKTIDDLKKLDLKLVELGKCRLYSGVGLSDNSELIINCKQVIKTTKEITREIENQY